VLHLVPQGFLQLARTLLNVWRAQFRAQPHQSPATPQRKNAMLKSFMQPPSTPTPKNEPARSAAPGYEPTRPSESYRSTPAKPDARDVTKSPSEDGRKLIVGPNIKLRGSEITDCEILVVEGRVEASMKSRDIRIAEGGVFAGKAEIDVAEVRGTFEGDLTARKKLIIYATGKVTGVIRYGAMMVEEGGMIAGDVGTLASGSPTTGRTENTETQPAATIQEQAADATQQGKPVAALSRRQG
jgi:cytoskeletal protein CcmA (bactofilin family)